MSPALRQSWGRWKASPALPRASASAGLPSPPQTSSGCWQLLPCNRTGGAEDGGGMHLLGCGTQGQPGRGHVEAQRRGRSSGDELILSWAQDHKPETLSNGPRCVLSQFRWDNSRERQKADLISMARCGSGASSPAFLTHFLEKPGLHQGTREPGPECKGDGCL